ncbi:alcohol dehydrogenase, putative [Coccidioides posadasii C735 delta SOWgp]|uniref:D-xylose reductase [NAD(P)H] n=1 Tax=Coccidioides posadasii (strain C735) TaxID=222929 RepID=C5P486_COCP7|nr:alcohol dehydrogenase, putative [Coccidioides posadasii C735 delta SOWgp]EER28504.1 alcohol dehydrogenase, putative [Coccidioides posadasii C735 delta SOWgp]|eukprot:XP_003070649.1 alcohol dehydrogenase, putative [Coccidioides posadasii C735 delta SOWgp]
MPIATSFALKNTSIRIPARGLGTFQVDPSLYPEGSVKDSVLHALKVGYRHIDAALAYGWGSVERDIGAAIRASGVPREDVFVVTKLHNCFHAPEDVEVGMNMSLKNLGLAYVDLYLMHFPYAYTKGENYSTVRKLDGKQPVVDIELSRAFDTTWKAMENLVDQGKAKLIGVSNFSTPKLKRLLSVCRIFPVVNQVELNPYFPQKTLLRFCHEHEIHVTAYGPLGCTPVPYLIGRKTPGPLEDCTVSDQILPGLSLPAINPPFNHSTQVKAMAERYSRTPAQIILAHLIMLGVSVIPKSNNLSRISENFDCLVELSPEDHAALGQLMGSNGEKAVRNLETKEYLGFDNFNEEFEEP